MKYGEFMVQSVQPVGGFSLCGIGYIMMEINPKRVETVL